MKQLFTLITAAIIIGIVFTQKDPLLQMIESGGVIAYPVSILLVAFLVFFPVLPYPVLAGMIGAVFGLAKGTGLSLAGIFIGTLLMFFMARYGFQSWIQRKLIKYPKVQEYETLFETNAFFSILVARLIPVIPSPLINILSGLSRIPWYTFIAATILGKAPAVFIFTAAGTIFETNKWLSVLIYLTYFLVITVITTLKLQSNNRIQSEKM
ncbi:TVP38/TMEM64 family protein [Peribacillus glennii]|uniref:TVP38/TMEM64 family membrane protein n=1 Tax=Peribacillus glennii TaxID=2303991 RepID=A0A372LHD1_9BACI|nr:TVP38/TMEM64 family protein [Peribacillus glennii]RFU65362.1 TVP38/TMEM64 family protein [Peribacillus glennii]